MVRMSLFRLPLLAGTPQQTLYVQLSAIQASLDTKPLTHALVQLVNAWDEYEVNVLKALLHHRPPGRSADKLEGENLDYADESLPSAWAGASLANPPSLLYALSDWLVQATRNPHERRWVFSEVFGIESRLGETEAERLAYEAQRDR